MSKSRIYPVTKIDAAVDQLDWSIRLFLDERAYVPAITLAGAAEEILGRLANDLAMVKRLSIGLSQKHALPEKLLRDEHLNGLRNWLKHWKDLKDQDRVEVDLEAEAVGLDMRVPRSARMKALRIKRIAAERGRRLEVEWSNGERHVVDLSTAIADSRGLRKLATPAAFRTALVGEHGHSVGWAGDVAIGADTLRRLALEQTGDFTAPSDFAAWRASLGLSLAQAARAFGLSRRMVAYYDSGERPVPRIVALACRGYLAAARAA